MERGHVNSEYLFSAWLYVTSHYFGNLSVLAFAMLSDESQKNDDYLPGTHSCQSQK